MEPSPVVQLNAFVPAKDLSVSKQFYSELGFTLVWGNDDIGWHAARRLADLPSVARAYLDRLEALSGVSVRYVSVGTRRDQIIEV